MFNIFKKKQQVLIKSPKGDATMSFHGKYAEDFLASINDEIENFEVKKVQMEGGDYRMKYTSLVQDQFMSLGSNENCIKIFIDKGTIIYKFL